MKATLANLLFIGAVVLFTSCAATYKQVHPAKLDYPVLDTVNSFSYKYNVLRNAGNKKLVKKENKENINIVAIKFTNTTGRSMKYGENFKIYTGNSEVVLIDPAAASTSIRQTAPLYFLYLLLTPTTLNVSDGRNTSSTPIGYVLGPALAVGNFAVAATANKNFKTELLAHNIIGREIKNGETFYGLIAIKENGFLPLSIKITQ